MKTIEDYNKYISRAIRTMYGYDIMADKSVVICSLACNVERELNNYFLLTGQLEKYFARTDYIIYENGSTDNTKQILQDWQSEIYQDDKYQFSEHFKHCFHVISEDIVKPNFDVNDTSKERSEWMSQCRNKYLDKVKEEFSKYDYMIVIDTDLNYWSIEGIANSFGFTKERDWDAITANGIDMHEQSGLPMYYDSWSFVLRGLLHNHVAIECFDVFNSPSKIDSGFGGLGIYKISSILNSQYHCVEILGHPILNYEDIRPASEHVGLHMDMKNDGYNEIYLNPQQVVIR